MPPNTPRIALTNFYDTRSLRAWSGIPYFIWKTLERQGVPVEVHGPFEYQPSWLDHLGASLAWSCQRRMWRRMLRWRYIRQLGAMADTSLEGTSANVILSTDAFFAPFLKCPLPIVEWTDVTYRNMRNYYWYYSRIPRWQERQADDIQRAILKRNALTIYSSDWAARTAIEYYGLPEDKVAVVPYGANLDCSRTQADIERIIGARTLETCRLLFVGKVWDRKGGDIAVAVAGKLQARGIPVRLTIVGSEPPKTEVMPDFVELTGFIDKGTEAGRQRMELLYEQAHFFILPSRAEGFGIVFCEAASFGLPSLANRTGGIPSAIVEGLSGFTFPIDEGQAGTLDPKASKGPHAVGSDWLPPTVPYPVRADTPLIRSYVERIAYFMHNPEQYRALCRSTFGIYQKSHNYDSAVKRVLQLIEERVLP